MDLKDAFVFGTTITKICKFAFGDDRHKNDECKSNDHFRTSLTFIEYLK